MARIRDEFDRARTFVIHRLGGFDGGVADGGADFFGHAGGRGLLDDFLVAALQRTVALEQMHDIAKTVAENLDLEMARAGDIVFQQHAVIAEGGFCLAPAGGEGGDEILGFVQPCACPCRRRRRPP